MPFDGSMVYAPLMTYIFPLFGGRRTWQLFLHSSHIDAYSTYCLPRPNLLAIAAQQWCLVTIFPCCSPASGHCAFAFVPESLPTVSRPECGKLRVILWDCLFLD